MIIRQEQIEIVGNTAAEQLPVNIEAFICSQWPELARRLRPDILRKRIRTGIAIARTHGFDTQHAMCAFVSLMLTVSPSFYAFPHISEILNNNVTMSADERLCALLFETTDRDWPEPDDEADAAEWRRLSGGRDGEI